VAVIDAAARWYREFLPAEEVHDPEMTPEQWDAEARTVRWYGTFDGETLVGVMGLERRGTAAPLRHAYVLSACQRRGIGARLREHLEAVAAGAERIAR
jgi:GNAT superfamily N-acetyltransferase